MATIAINPFDTSTFRFEKQNPSNARRLGSISQKIYEPASPKTRQMSVSASSWESGSLIDSPKVVDWSDARRRSSVISLMKPAVPTVTKSEVATKVCFVGAGYVGGPTAAVLAFANPNVRVTVVDTDVKRIRRWGSMHLPIHEPGLTNVVRIARDGVNAVTLEQQDSLYQLRVPAREPNLFFSNDLDTGIGEADIIFICVNTPTKTAGIGAGAAANLSILESAVEKIAAIAKPGAIIVEKSTVPCRTAEVVREKLRIFRPNVPFVVLSNPEFLAEGTAIDDLLNPPRILIGTTDTPMGHAAAAQLAALYETWVPSERIVTIRLWSSELAKLVANAMLAQRISSMNTVSAICEKTGADIDDIARAIGIDPRIGPHFLKAGLGFGGSCFKKDILSLSYLAESLDLPEVSAYWKTVVEINQWQCARFVKRVVKTLHGSLMSKKIALLGYAFKKNTADTRESQAIDVVRQLLQEEKPAEIAIFDPQCNRQDVKDELTAFFSKNGVPILKPEGPVEVYATAHEACTNATAVLILTDWDQFRYPSLTAANRRVEALPLSNLTSPRMSIDCGTASVNIVESPAIADNEVMRSESIFVRLDPQNDHLGRFRDEPACPEYCKDCKRGHHEEEQANENVDWKEIARLMRQPRWVFDGRGVVDQKGMEKLGFRVESIGKAEFDSPLNR